MTARPFHIFIFLVVLGFCCLPWTVFAESDDDNKPAAVLETLRMCEGVQDSRMVSPTVVFSVLRERAFCYTRFDPVNRRTYVYHNWYRRDRQLSSVRLLISTPAWSTFSSMQLRKNDIGPWRVEVTDEKGVLLSTTYFSVTE